MKPFNLEQAKAGKPLVTRDGRKARYLGVLEAALRLPLIAAVSNASGSEQAVMFTIDGNYCLDRPLEHCNDLFMEPEVVTKWINVFVTSIEGKYYSDTRVFDTEDDAVLAAEGIKTYHSTTSVQIVL